MSEVIDWPAQAALTRVSSSLWASGELPDDRLWALSKVETAAFETVEVSGFIIGDAVTPAPKAFGAI